jgi:hypothetical protein
LERSDFTKGHAFSAKGRKRREPAYTGTLRAFPTSKHRDITPHSHHLGHGNVDKNGDITDSSKYMRIVVVQWTPGCLIAK